MLLGLSSSSLLLICAVIIGAILYFKPWRRMSAPVMPTQTEVDADASLARLGPYASEDDTPLDWETVEEHKREHIRNRFRYHILASSPRTIADAVQDAMQSSGMKMAHAKKRHEAPFIVCWAYDIAAILWADGQIPKDVMAGMVANFMDMPRNTRPMDRDIMATLVAPQGHYFHLEQLYNKKEKDIPRVHLRTCLAKAEQEKYIHRDEQWCLRALGDWNGMMKAAGKRPTKEIEALLLLGDGIAEEGLDVIAKRLASLGDADVLVRLYNPEKIGESEEEKKPFVTPPTVHLRACMEEAKLRMAADKAYAMSVATCCIHLGDWVHARELADVFIDRQYPEAAGKLLFAIRKAEREASSA